MDLTELEQKVKDCEDLVKQQKKELRQARQELQAARQQLFDAEAPLPTAFERFRHWVESELPSVDLEWIPKLDKEPYDHQLGLDQFFEYRGPLFWYERRETYTVNDILCFIEDEEVYKESKAHPKDWDLLLEFLMKHNIRSYKWDW